MPSILTLSALKSGQRAVVRMVHGTGAMYERLCDLGFTPDSPVTCLFSSVMGDPRAYRIKGSVIALRNCDAKQIECTLGGGEI